MSKRFNLRIKEQHKDLVTELDNLEQQINLGNFSGLLSDNKVSIKGNKMANLTATLDSVLQFLPNFEGKNQEDVVFFVKQYDDLMSAFDLDKKTKLILLKSKIEGKARELCKGTCQILYIQIIMQNLKRH